MPALSIESLSPKEQKLLVNIWQCLYFEPTVNYLKLTRLLGLKHPGLAAATWRSLKRQLRRGRMTRGRRKKTVVMTRDQKRTATDYDATKVPLANRQDDLGFRNATCRSRASIREEYPEGDAKSGGCASWDSSYQGSNEDEAAEAAVKRLLPSIKQLEAHGTGENRMDRSMGPSSTAQDFCGGRMGVPAPRGKPSTEAILAACSISTFVPEANHMQYIYLEDSERQLWAVNKKEWLRDPDKFGDHERIRYTGFEGTLYGRWRSDFLRRAHQL